MKKNKNRLKKQKAHNRRIGTVYNYNYCSYLYLINVHIVLQSLNTKINMDVKKKLNIS